MRKISLSIMGIFLSFFICSEMYAQQIQISKTPVKKPVKLHKAINSTEAGSECDSVNLNAAGDWDLALYGVGGGYLTGTNRQVINGGSSGNFTIKEQANLFDLSGSDYGFITGALVYAIGNPNNASGLPRKILFNVYDDDPADTTPASLLASVEKTLQEIKNNSDNDLLTEVLFDQPIPIPESKKFYLSADHTDLRFTVALRDSFAIVSTADDVTDGSAYQKLVNTQNQYAWISVKDFWQFGPTDPANLTLLFFPFVSVTETSCQVVPVRIVSFTAAKKQGDAEIKWTVAQEINISKYELQRADNDNSFKTVATINAVNGLNEHSYTLTDKDVFLTSRNTSVQYRLKQIDMDGTAQYSKVINLKTNSSINNISFANPFTGDLQIHIALNSSQNISASLYDMQGRKVASLPKIIRDGSSSIILPGTSLLKPGTYMLSLQIGTETMRYKVIK